MKLTIKTKSVEIEYQDDYSMLEKEVKDRLLDVIKVILQFEEELLQATPKEQEK